LNEEYHQQIKLIRTTLQEYYPDTMAKPLLTMLDKLDEQNLSPALPQIHGAYKQLLMAQQSSQAMPEKQYQASSGIEEADKKEQEQPKDEEDASAEAEQNVTDKQE